MQFQHPFALDVESLPRRDQDFEGLRVLHQLSDQRRAGKHLFEVIQHQEHPLVVEVLCQLHKRRGHTLLVEHQTQHIGQRRDDQLRRFHRRQGHEEDAIEKSAQTFLGDVLRQTGLADAAGSGEGHQPHIRVGQQAVEFGQFRYTPDESGGLHGQVVARLDPGRQRRKILREIGRDDLEKMFGLRQPFQQMISEV